MAASIWKRISSNKTDSTQSLLRVCGLGCFVARRISGHHRPAGTSKSVAVGTEIAPRPPHRSVRAAFPHTAPTSGE
jgi:hypothetical protein